MRRLLVGSIILILLLTSMTLGCFEDSDDGKKNKPPVADVGDDIEALSLTVVQFDGTNSSDPDGKIKSYEWDFGDLKNPTLDTSTGERPTYTYNSPGKYTVTLSVTDDDSATGTDTLEVVIINRKPVVDVGSDIVAKPFEIIYFNGTATDLDGYIRSYEWDFDGDGTIDWHAAAIGATTHFYETPGSYLAKFSVTDNFEEVMIAVKNITIIEIVKLPPLADAGLNQSVPVGQVMLKGTGYDPDGAIALYEWDFDGDGIFDWSSTSTGIVNHSYLEEGKFIARFRATDDSGLTGDANVTITVNNSYAAHKVSADIFIDWNSTSKYDYIIKLNDAIDDTKLKIIVTDIATGWDEEFDISQMTQSKENEFKLTSAIKPYPGHALQVQVLYYQTLIGARVLDIVNQSHEFIGPDMDFMAGFDLDRFLEERNRADIEKISVRSIGDLKIEQKGDLFHTSLRGIGEYYYLDRFEGAETEVTINCTELWINITMSKGKLVSESISMLGHGTMVSTIGNDDLVMDINIEEMILVRENDRDMENFMYGEGTFYGSIEDPETGMDVEMEGDVYVTSELIGNDHHENRAGEEYPCSIFYNNVTMDGETGLSGSPMKTKFESTVINTTWNTDLEKFSNNTIYYEYTMITQVANQDIFDSGSGYPKYNPTRRKPELHISDIMQFDTPRPRVLLGDDSMMLESPYGVRLRLMVTSDLEIKIGNEVYPCVNIRGEIIDGGNSDGKSEGYVILQLISSGDFAGLPVSTFQDLHWRDEHLKSEEELKYIQKK